MGAGEGANIISFLAAEFTQRAVKVNILYKLVSSLAEEKTKNIMACITFTDSSCFISTINTHTR